MDKMNLALVHEYLTRYGGAERVLKEISDLYPQAPIYTLLKDESKIGEWFTGKEIEESFLSTFPGFLKNRVKYMAPFCPTAIESIDLSRFDVVISSSNSFAKGVVTKPKTVHISYCHAPMTFVWDVFYSYILDQKKGGVTNFFIKLISHYLRQWDRQAADRVDFFIANSKTTQARIKKFYRRDSEVIYPPVDVDKFIPTATYKDYFLIVSQLTPYKKIDVAVKAFNRMGKKLVVIGDGQQREYLQKIAGENIEILGFLSDQKVIEYMQNCRAFIFPGNDDFGIAPVEAMAAGKPVLALRDGGVTETVIEGVTGEFFDYPIEELIADGVRRLLENEDQYDYRMIRKQAEKFDTKIFRQKFSAYVDKCVDTYRLNR
jgi:glycosyltransferase involved in cell wall biosynthesis